MIKKKVSIYKRCKKCKLIFRFKHLIVNCIIPKHKVRQK